MHFVKPIKSMPNTIKFRQTSKIQDKALYPNQSKISKKKNKSAKPVKDKPKSSKISDKLKDSQLW